MVYDATIAINAGMVYDATIAINAGMVYDATITINAGMMVYDATKQSMLAWWSMMLQ